MESNLLEGKVPQIIYDSNIDLDRHEPCWNRCALFDNERSMGNQSRSVVRCIVLPHESGKCTSTNLAQGALAMRDADRSNVSGSISKRFAIPVRIAKLGKQSNDR